jgi:acyl-CoA thioesterase FadM
MAHLELDFLREVRPPAVVEVRLEVARVGRTSLDHAIELRDLGVDAAGEPVLAARGRATHVWTERASGRSMPWPPEVLARCWAG